MQLDRRVGGAEAVLPFFGAPARFPLGAATLARSTGCPIVPLFSLYADRRRRTVRVMYEAPIEVERTRDRAADLARATARLVEVYERYVRAYPDQWFNFYDFWDPPGTARPA